MTDDEITEFLFIRNDPEAADVAMVFGAAEEEDMRRRVAQGVSVYRDGYVPKLLVTGGGVLAREHPEAEQMAQIAVEMGVPEANLLIENKSSDTFENVQLSIELLERVGLIDDIKRIILVSSEWHMRRALLTAMRFFPDNIQFLCCSTTEGCNRDNWRASKTCRDTVRHEALLLEVFLQAGAL